MIEAIRNWFRDATRELESFLNSVTPGCQAAAIPQRTQTLSRVDPGGFTSRRPSPTNESQPELEPKVSVDEESGRNSQLFTAKIEIEDMEAIFADGPVKKSDAVAALCNRTGCKQAAAYLALGEKGRFAHRVCKLDGGFLGLS